MASTILVADDSTTMRMIVKSVLSQAGWQVLAASNGKEALDLAQTSQVDLVVSDWNMPVLGGLGLIQGLREQPQYQDVPVLVLTTEEDDISKSAARELGVSGWLNKPLDPQVLVDLAAELLGEMPQG
ncbi:response regulator [Bordetella genomosp. 13]|uniref:Two-component system response regulator n=1 Tax=Bordetella genomosp. 13 TaxID=463040 RepID=A0A1W6ZBV7_9BORD|nr:response regulator [Bordetella genomosp. 13]ARP94334.1 two-component system response regulator [Bordetella genomosp. 13]